MKKTMNRGLFSLPYVIISIIFVVVPLLLVFMQAFKGADGSFTFSNFKVLVDGVNIIVLVKSLGMALLNTIICLVVAYPLAYLLANPKFNKSAILVLLFIMPMWINFLLRTYALRTLLEMISFKLGFTATMIGMFYDFFPFMLLPIYTVLANMDKSYVEAAQDLGANPLKTFISVTLRLSVPGIVSGALMVFMPTISAFAIVDMLGSADVFIFGSIINSYFKSDSSWGIGSVMSLVMMALVVIVVLLSKLFTRGKSRMPATSASLGGKML